MINYNNFSEKFNVDIKYIDDNPIFRISHLGKYLQLSNIHQTISNIDFNDKKKIKCITNGGEQNISYITLYGLKKLIAKCKKPTALILAKELGIDILNFKKLDAEIETIDQIQKVFRNENMITQYMILCKYKIDLYFPDYNLAIECDEKFHNNNLDKDIERETQIKNKLNCVFIRFNPDSKNFDIFDIINKIFMHIKNFIQKDNNLHEIRYL
jgi:very-short-patch-repair endonuclease